MRATPERQSSVDRGAVFDWPTLGGLKPVWTGRGFQIGSGFSQVLDYEAGDSGWSDALTLFHEDVAGDGAHPIDVASRRRARRALKQYLSVSTTPTLLEIGCSSGFLLTELVRDWPLGLIIGSDYISGPLNRLSARLPALPLLRFDLVKCPLPSASLDGVVLLNVLEHIQDDAGALEQVARVLKPSGIAVVEVPAGPQLYDAYDKYLRHFRRYQLDQICELVERTGLQVLERSHLGFFVYPMFALVKLRNRRALDAPEDVQRAVVARNISQTRSTPVLKWMTTVEEYLGNWIRYPVGIRCVVTAIKP